MAIRCQDDVLNIGLFIDFNRKEWCLVDLHKWTLGCRLDARQVPGCRIVDGNAVTSISI